MTPEKPCHLAPWAASNHLDFVYLGVLQINYLPIGIRNLTRLQVPSHKLGKHGNTSGCLHKPSSYMSISWEFAVEGIRLLRLWATLSLALRASWP